MVEELPILLHVFKINSEEINYDIIDIKLLWKQWGKFGGNNITYRIMQYLKILLLNTIQIKDGVGINDLILISVSLYIEM